ncbi:UNVERIFIED_CONTAM: hypothetical protein GTU68_047167 [Idotea baltica]|nr:hypothetical protein [Idotea baltica]
MKNKKDQKTKTISSKKDAENVALSKIRKKADSRDLVPYDSLTAYLREIRQYPKLTAEQEKSLAIRFKDKKDIQAAYDLVSSNLWLVVKIARDYEKAAKTLLDLIQEGNIGLMEAVKNFDPYKGVRLPSYAAWWIKAYIIKYLIANWRMVKIGTTQAQRKLFFNLQKEKDKLEQAGIYPSPKMIADNLNLKEKEVIEMEQRLGSYDLSVDAPLSDDSTNSLHSVLPDTNENAEDIFAKKQIKDVFAEGISKLSELLSEKERIILNKRMLAEKKKTLTELAEELSLSAERVRQIENELKGKIKDFFKKNYAAEIENIEF